jgi:hypothetical protein
MGSNKDKDELMLGLLLKLVILILFNIELVFELFLPPWLFLDFSDVFWLFLIAASAHNSKASEILWVSLGSLADVST